MAFSTISNLQQALNCAGKCDCCNKLQAQINDLKAEIARIPKLDENRLVTATKAALQPDITTAVAAGGTVIINKLRPEINSSIEAAKNSFERTLQQMNDAVSGVRKTANVANSKATQSLGETIANAREIELTKGLAQQAKNSAVAATRQATSAVTESAKAVKTTLDTASDVSGLKGVVNGVKGTIGKLGETVVAVEKSVGTAITKAAEAIGISKQALGTVGRFAGQFLAIFNAIATIFTILDGMATREVLGARLDAVEAGLAAQGRDISGVLGRLFQLVNRVKNNETATESARNLAFEARGIGLQATSLAQSAQISASNAQSTASVARGAALQAQTTADGAVKNASIANNNAKIADTRARQAEATATTATNAASQAQQKAERAIGEAQAIQTKAERAIDEARTAQTKAERATSEAQVAQQKAEKSQQSVNTLDNKVLNLETKINGLNSAIPPLNNAVGNVINIANGASNTANAALNQFQNSSNSLQNQLDQKFNQIVQQNKQDLGIKGLETSSLSKEFDKKFSDFQRLSKADADTRFKEFTQQNERSLGIKRLETSSLSKEFDKKFSDFQRLLKADADTRFKEFIEQNKKALAIPNKKIDSLQTQQRESEKMNKEGLEKLDQIIPMLAGIPLIPALAANAIRPSIPTLPQIETAAAAGTCRTTQPGGCMRRALDDNAANIANNANRNSANILDALNTGANAALLQGQQTILTRLGAQLPGGIGGKLSRFTDWLQLDRALNLLILAATIHNALMLSNDIGQTLLGAINNVLQLIGLKKEDGSNFDIGSVISGSIENLIKGAIGADNYIQLKEAWAKANRVYQATTNVLNSFLNLSQTILQASELIAAYTGRIGNALKKGGVILENAYGWMNPQPRFNRITTFLEGLQNGASTIQMVTQAPLDIITATTEFTTASTEFVKAIKEDDKPANKPASTPEPDQLKAKETQSKIESQPLSFDFSDLFDGED
ncbi:hypothetical protein [Nostoc sp. FACHB-888]|uniref:hypothetical protein n=1 Tax=Nostoc sp. FACHB-888 TaxID=2692842 RepID=UPI001685C686|nr:hypothetical protein [Nostoc sp. FACHB-888]MBD2243221.1 hypothetical protein [Nostoc sp. FACHB-888]